MVVEDVHELDDHALVRALRALGDTTRFRMVQEIAAGGELCCGEVAERFDVTQPTISHHLKVLCLAGVLSVRCQGKHRFISVNQALLSSLANLLPARLMPAQKPRLSRVEGHPRARRAQDPRLAPPQT
jgi:ArsR family transcriptional regulator